MNKKTNNTINFFTKSLLEVLLWIYVKIVKKNLRHILQFVKTVEKLFVRPAPY